MQKTTNRHPFQHEAWLYAGIDEFVARIAAFARDAVEHEEPVLVAVPSPKISMLREALGPVAGGVTFADMVEIGRNPARIIPAWRDFVTAHRGAPSIRGVGEPLYAGRGPAEREECHAHEALLNVALADAPIRLVCPYDITALSPDDIDRAMTNHPVVQIDGHRHGNASVATVEWLETALPEPASVTADLAFDLDTLHTVRRLVDAQASALGFDAVRREEVVLVASEIATNSLRHGGGRGTVRCWAEGATFLCEVRDAGWIREPMVGRVRPEPAQVGGHGIWLANLLADLVQVRSTERGTVVRMHFNC